MQLSEAIERVFLTIEMQAGVKTATLYVSEKLTVKATRVLFGGKVDRRKKRTEYRVTIGPPNYAEREFIKKAKKLGDKFPIREVFIKRI